MSAELIERLNELHAKATPGPWGDGWRTPVLACDRAFRKHSGISLSLDDSALLLALRNAWPEIAAGWESLREERDALQRELDEFDEYVEHARERKAEIAQLRERLSRAEPAARALPDAAAPDQIRSAWIPVSERLPAQAGAFRVRSGIYEWDAEWLPAGGFVPWNSWVGYPQHWRARRDDQIAQARRDALEEARAACRGFVHDPLSTPSYRRACAEIDRMPMKPVGEEVATDKMPDDDDDGLCDRCGGDGWIEAWEGDGSDWGEDTYSGPMDESIPCRACGGTGVRR